MGFRHLISILRRLSHRLPDADRPLRPISYGSLAGARIAVDTNLYLHLCRNGPESPTQIADLFASWARHIMSFDIEPIFVFDGADRTPFLPTTSKSPAGVVHRESVRPVTRCDHWKETSHVELQRPGSVVDSGIWSRVKRALDHEHVAWIVATHDADSFCALLAHDALRLVDAIVSEDSDLIALGAPRLVRGLFSEFLPAAHRCQESVHEIDLNNVRRALGDLSQEQLIRFCVALGKQKSASMNHGINMDQALRLAAAIRSGVYQADKQSNAKTEQFLATIEQQNPGMLHPGPDHPPTSLLQWAELYRIKRAYARIDRNATGRRSRLGRTM